MRVFFVAAALLSLAGVSFAEQQAKPEWDFQGRFLVVASDADMLASAYENGKLGPRNGDDKLSIIPLDVAPMDYQAYDINATNSVAGPPSVVAVSPSGRYAYVIETFTARPGKSDNETFADLRLGNTLSVFDLKNPKRPKLLEQREVPTRPLSVSVNHNGSLLAISYHPSSSSADRPLSIHRLQQGRVIDNQFPEVPDWNVGDELIDVKWHPKQNTLSLINTTSAVASFTHVIRDGDNVQLRPWGNTVSVGKKPFIGRFSEDGHHFLVNNLFWGNDVIGHWTEAPRGIISNIHLAHGQTAEGVDMHSLTSQVLVGPSPEGFAVSPNGAYVAAVNMERSWLPYDDPRQTWHSSISLIERNPETGAMRVVHTLPYYAVLPEMAVFDASSQYLAAVRFDHYDPSKDGASVDFFKIVSDPLVSRPATLVQTQYSVPVQHGAHDMVLVK